MWWGLCVSGQVHSEASEARQRKLFADDDDSKVRNNLSFSLSQSLYLVLTFFPSPFVSLLSRPLVPRWFKQKGPEFPIQGLWSKWYESGRSVGCLGCSGTSDHNLGCLTLKGSLERQTEEHVRNIKRGLDVVLHVLVPVSGAKDSRPLVDIVLAYLNDPKGLLDLISEARQNPAVAANLLARRREYDESVLAAVAATHERLRKHTINICVCVCYLTLALLA
jgi:hypothetical protein